MSKFFKQYRTLIVLLVIAAVIVGLYFYLKNEDQKALDEVAESTTDSETAERFYLRQ